MKNRFEFAVNLARQMGNLTLEYFDSDSMDVEKKQDGTPVTKADRGAEALGRKLIMEAFPDD